MPFFSCYFSLRFGRVETGETMINYLGLQIMNFFLFQNKLQSHLHSGVVQ